MYNTYKFIVKKPFFSIIIPTYNRESDLQFALYCIFQQNFSDFEVIVSDNCSTDNTQAIFSKLKDKRIHYYRSEKNVDFALNVKRSVKYAKGKYIFFHSDDDFLLYSNSLQKIHDGIKKTNAGYIRINYLCLSPDKKRIFYFKVNKPFTANEYAPPLLDNKKVLSFITDSDPYFITGIIFKNNLPSKIEIVNSDPAPWIEILFYVVKKFGAYFISYPYIVGSWSRREIKNNEKHHFFTLVNGELRAEKYFNLIKKKINKERYNAFLHNELMLHYVRSFPVIKFHVGNKNMLQISKRLLLLDQTIAENISYWIFFVFSFIFPKSLLKIFRDIYLNMYIRFSRVDDYGQIVDKLKELERGFLISKENVIGREDPIFKF